MALRSTNMWIQFVYMFCALMIITNQNDEITFWYNYMDLFADSFTAKLILLLFQVYINVKLSTHCYVIFEISRGWSLLRLYISQTASVF